MYFPTNWVSLHPHAVTISYLLVVLVLPKGLLETQQLPKVLFHLLAIALVPTGTTNTSYFLCWWSGRFYLYRHQDRYLLQLTKVILPSRCYTSSCQYYQYYQYLLFPLLVVRRFYFFTYQPSCCCAISYMYYQHLLLPLLVVRTFLFLHTNHTQQIRETLRSSLEIQYLNRIIRY